MLILTPCICYCSYVNDIFAYAYLQSKIQREQKALVPSRSGRMEERFAETRTPTQTVNEHGTVTVAIIIITLASITNIISEVSNPG